MKFDVLLVKSDEIFVTVFQSHCLFESILLYFKCNINIKDHEDFPKYTSPVLLSVRKAFQASSLVEPLGNVRIVFSILSEREGVLLL